MNPNIIPEKICFVWSAINISRIINIVIKICSYILKKISYKLFISSIPPIKNNPQNKNVTKYEIGFITWEK